MANIFLAGTGSFGAAVADELTTHGHKILGVAAPRESRRGGYDPLALWAKRASVNHVNQDVLSPDSVPDGVDAILTAHSHSFIGRLTRARAPYALGYHPSLLPLHRGRAAVEWTARMGERVTGGTVYHLTDRVDGGPIALQEHVILPPGMSASAIWREHLFPLGLKMLVEAADAVDNDTVRYRPQDDRKATWEPSLDSKPLYRPELLELP